MVVSQGEVWWADLGDPIGSEPGFRRPVIIIQGDPINRSRLATVICVVLTGNLKWAHGPGNVPLTPRMTGLSKESVANLTQVVTLDREALLEKTGKISRQKLHLLFSGLDVVLDRRD